MVDTLYSHSKAKGGGSVLNGPGANNYWFILT